MPDLDASTLSDAKRWRLKQRYSLDRPGRSYIAERGSVLTRYDREHLINNYGMTRDDFSRLHKNSEILPDEQENTENEQGG